MKTLSTLAAVLALSAAFLTGCQNGAKLSADGGPPKSESATLVRPLSGMLAQAVLERADAGKPLPDDFKTPEYINSVTDTIRAQFPDAFAVTDEQEKALASGTFDDAGNAQKLNASIAEAEKLKLKLSVLNAFLVQQTKEGKLQGIQLEIATRLLGAQVAAASAPASAEAPKQ